MGRRKGRNGGARKQDAVGEYASDAWSLAKRTAYGLNEIRKLINIETKVLDTTNGANIPNTGTISTISTIAQGLNYTDRIGDSIKMQRMEVRFRWQIGASATKTFVRAIVFRDLDNYGTAPAVTDLLEAADVLAPVKYLNKDRFSVLYDEVQTLQSVNETASVSVFCTPHEGHIKYLGTTAANASNGKGSVYICWVGSEATNQPRIDFYTRIYFTDD